MYANGMTGPDRDARRRSAGKRGIHESEKTRLRGKPPPLGAPFHQTSTYSFSFSDAA